MATSRNANRRRKIAKQNQQHTPDAQNYYPPPSKTATSTTRWNDFDEGCPIDIITTDDLQNGTSPDLTPATGNWIGDGTSIVSQDSNHQDIHTRINNDGPSTRIRKEMLSHTTQRSQHNTQLAMQETVQEKKPSPTHTTDTTDTTDITQTATEISISDDIHPHADDPTKNQHISAERNPDIDSPESLTIPEPVTTIETRKPILPIYEQQIDDTDADDIHIEHQEDGISLQADSETEHIPISECSTEEYTPVQAPLKKINSRFRTAIFFTFGLSIGLSAAMWYQQWPEFMQFYSALINK